MSQLTHSARKSDGGRTEVTIADGLVYVDIFRGDHHVDQRVFNASDLVNLNVDRILIAAPQRSGYIGRQEGREL